MEMILKVGSFDFHRCHAFFTRHTIPTPRHTHPSVQERSFPYSINPLAPPAPPLPIHNDYFALVSTPSYSLTRIYPNVLSKCRLGFSNPATFSPVPKLLWINSMRPFRYLVVTASFSWSK